MQRFKHESVVGIFFLIGCLCVGYLTVKLGKMEIMGGDYYTVDARFTNVSGLKTGGFVQLAGVPIGQVEKITLDMDELVAIVSMKIQQDVHIDEEAIASVKTSGLIGDKYIKISPGGAEAPIADGGIIVDTESTVDFEDLISKYIFGKV
ncbi:outer membrane lipid asymmetry maintenance protein MlaD [Desulfoplanes sp.]